MNSSNVPSIDDILEGAKATIKHQKCSHDDDHDVTASVLQEFTYQAFEMHGTNLTKGGANKLMKAALCNRMLGDMNVFISKAKEGNGQDVEVPWHEP